MLPSDDQLAYFIWFETRSGSIGDPRFRPRDGNAHGTGSLFELIGW